jgi:hypothetical protein
MLQAYARPSFGGLARPPEYYMRVRQIIATLRETASQATIAQHLNEQGFSTLRGKAWDRQAVGNFLRNTAV